MLTPKDIHNKEFKRSLRGYDLDDVDQFLDQIIKDMEELYKENASLREECDKNKQKLDHFLEIETSLNRALVLADKTAEEIKAEALKEKDLILAEARRESVLLLEKAEVDARRFNEMNLELVDQAENFKNNLVGMLESQIRMIRESGSIEEVVSFRQALQEKIQLEKTEPSKEDSEVSSQTENPEESANFSLEYEDTLEEETLEDDGFQSKIVNFLDRQ